MGHRRPWTADTDRRLIENYNAGDLTIRQIAAGLGRSSSAVHARIQTLRAAGRLGRRNRPTREGLWSTREQEGP